MESQLMTIDGLHLAYAYRRRRSKKTSEVVLLVHGLGASKEDFASTFESGHASRFSLLAFDLLGFGASAKPVDDEYTMERQVGLVRRALDELRITRFHLIGHSMGGLIGVNLVEALSPGRVLSFVNVEGNLTPEDCSFSRNVAGQTENEFVEHGFDDFLQFLRDNGRQAGKQSLLNYAATVAKTTAIAYHRSAISLVTQTDTPGLLERFVRLPCPKLYLYGEANRGVPPSEVLLRKAEVPHQFVPRAGHMMMDDNPEDFNALVFEFISHVARQ